MEGTMETRNEGENLLLRRTQTDLLQKLRQLQQWRQQQEEHLLQDKEKQMSLLRDKERRLHAVQEYQRKILENNNFVTSGTDGPLFQEKSAGFSEGQSSSTSFDMQSNDSVTTSVTQVSIPRINHPKRTVLLSPQHFKSSLANRNVTHVSPTTTKPQDQMLLTQKLQLPSATDEELSQFTESDGGSIGDIEGIRPIEETSEISEASVQEEDDIIYDNIDNEDIYNQDIDDNTLVSRDDSGDGNDDDHNGFDGSGDDRVDDDLDDGNDSDDVEYKENTNDQAGLPHHDVDSKPSFDDIPIKPGLGVQAKTFEEMLDQQLQEGQQSSKPEERSRSQTTFSTKRSFLKKGEGIARFGLKLKTGPAKQESPATVKDTKNNFVKPKAPVTRKTASVKQTAAFKQFVPVQQSGSRTRKSLQHNPVTDQGKQPFSPKKVKFNTEQSLSHPVDKFTDDILEERSSEYSLDSGNVEGVHESLASGNEVIIEDSFQERMKKWDELENVEKQELNEFELLEEAAAANCSLSSNSSTVLRILGKKEHRSGADLNNNVFGVRQKWIVPPKVEETVESDNDANHTLTEENLDDEENDTLKEPEVVSVRSSLALSDGFDDTKTWEDHDALDISDVTDDVMHALNTSTPDAKGQRSSQAKKRVDNPSTPPTSSLVTKLFPQLKAKNETSKSRINQKQPQQIKPQRPAFNETVTTQDVVTLTGSENNDINAGMSSAVRDKLQELEKEIEKFREENVALHKLREQREKDLKELQKERALFENYKTEELGRLEKFKNEEEGRLRRDKRVFEQYQKASRALPDKKEREEITSLKAKISELQEDLKLRESRWSAAATRYKDRINNLEKENREMKDEVKLLEKQNLDLQRREQQRIRELQQYKAFEKKKLRKPDEIPSKKSPPSNAPQIIEHKNEDSLGEDKTLTRVGIKKQVKSASDVHPSRKVISPAKRNTTTEGDDTIETQGIDKLDRNESTENASSVHERLQGPSPPTKKTVSSKSVRFKDDIQEEEKPLEFLPKQLSHSDGKREVINPDGSRLVTFTNGTRKEISADGLSVVVTFFNGDIKQIFPDERVEYYYAEVQTTHTTYPDGLEVLRFPSNQIEKHYPDGTKEIIFPDQTVKYLYTSGAEECVFNDGTVERISVDGERIVEFPNGQRETYTKLFKKREYPDGTVKTVFTDGRQETRYASGRLRVKDGEGRLLVDTAEQNMQAQHGAVS